MGGGTAALLTMMLRESSHPELRAARCCAIACPSVMTLELAACCAPFVTSIVNGTDIVPTFCAASVDRLREDVTRSSWYAEFSRDLRSGVVRAVQVGYWCWRWRCVGQGLHVANVGTAHEPSSLTPV